jgi:asparagine synthase (glutamine-hydrolysing)
MCGINGQLFFGDQAPSVNEESLRLMNACLAHRGPDDSGVYVDGAVGLAQTRLSIIDLSPMGHQPMGNEDGTIWIVFNGEIYNHTELRPELERAGHRFVGTSDTQVIIHAYEEYGIEGCLQRLRGMFAFAIWDSRKRLLTLARDRIGKKPLKYYQDGKRIIFASELKAILTDPSVNVTVDYQAIDYYLTHQYVPAPRTGFNEIRKLPAAHYLTCAPSGEMTLKRYWDLEYKPDSKPSAEEWKQRILHELDEAVRLRMVADVPVGAFLSGGVDSSAVVASMALQSASPVRTFSIGFGESSHNELPYARRIAEMYKTSHTEMVVEPSGIDLLPKLIYHYEEPYADSSALPTFCVSQLTRGHVKVALNGDGGDEAFAGYNWYGWIDRMGWLDAVAPLVGLASYPAEWWNAIRPSTRGRNRATFLESYRSAAAGRHVHWLAYFSPREKAALYHPEFARAGRAGRESPVWEHARAAGGGDRVNRALYTDIKSYLADDLVVKVDIASMACSLETRSPLLDHQFLEFSATIPSKLKLGKGGGKAIFKEALKDRVPQDLMYRKKQGFSVPLNKWFRGELAPWAREILLDPRTLGRKLFRREGIERLLDQHLSGRVDHGPRIWALLTLEFWFRQFVDQRARAPARMGETVA